MPIAINSPARNLFLLGSSGAQVVTNFFKAIDKAASSDSYYLPSELRYYEGPGEEDRFVLAGTAQDNRPDLFGWIENRNNSGTASFENRVVSTQNGTDTTLLALELDSNSKLIAAGKTGTIPWISRYAVDGALEWSTTTNSANVEYRGIASDSNGQYYACGVNNSAGIESFVEKFDASGNPGWGKRATLVGRDVILTAIDANNRGQVVAVGYIEDDSFNKGYIVKIDTTTGDIVWDRTVETSHDVDCTDVFIDTNDQIYITANIERQGTPGTWTGVLLKYTAEGNLIWQTESDPNFNDTVTFDKVQADGETEAVVVFGTYFDISSLVTQGMVTKYARNGSLVWRRTLESSEDSAFNFSNVSVDSDPSYYYILFTDDSISQGGGTPDRYTYGKISSSGNGLGAFQYNDGSGQTIDYVYTNMGDRIAKLVDGSVRQDTTELMTYPFSANKILFDDLATKITNKKRQLDSADPLVYSGSPAIRPPDNRSYELTEQLELNGTSDRLDNFNFTTGGKSELSVECWFQVDDITTPKPTSKGYIWDETPGATGAALRLSTDQKITTFTYAGGSAVLAQKPEVVQTGVWYHVVSTFGNGQTKLYVDGELEHTVNGTVSTIVDTGSYPFTIGASTDNSGTIGDAVFTTPGQYEFTVPDGVTDVSMVLVGGGGGGATSTTSANGQAGGGGGGGALMWRNGYTVSPGDILYVTVGEGGSGGTYSTRGNDDGTAGGDSYVRLNSHSGTIIARAGGGGKGEFDGNGGDARFPNAGIEYSSTYGGGGSVSGGGNGGEGGAGQPGFASGGGGGAGGYTGDGGRGQNGQLSNPASQRTVGQGGGGGGGGASNSTGTSPTTAGGGGVGIYGQGTSGGVSNSSNTASQSSIQSFAGSGGTSTDPNTTPAEKGYGGGGTGGEDDASAKAADGGSGAVRIIWGAGRSFPTTDVGAASAGADTREYLDGRVGELRAYDRILTAEDVAQAYNATKSKYINEAPDIAPKIGPGIVYDSNLLLNYDFGNRATYDRAENRYFYSQELDNNFWGIFNINIEKNIAIAPDGTKTADRLYATVVDTGHVIKPNIAIELELHTVSVYLKTAGDQYFTIRGDNQTNWITYDIINGVITANRTVNSTTAFIEDVGNGWYRCGLTYLPDTTGNDPEFFLVDSDDYIGTTFAGSGTGGVYVWGVQLEKGSVAGRYIRTYSSSVTAPTTVKNLSSSSYTGTINGGTTFNSSGYFDFDGVNGYIDTGYNPGAVTELTVEAWLRVDTYTNDGAGITIGDNSQGTGQCYLGRGNSGGDSMDWRFYTGTFLDETEFFTSDTGWKHYVGTYDQTGGAGSNQGRMRLYVDGNLEDTALSNNTSAIDFSSGANIRIGINTNGSSYFDGKYGEVRIYNRTLTATEVSQNFNATRAKYGV